MDVAGEHVDSLVALCQHLNVDSAVGGGGGHGVGSLVHVGDEETDDESGLAERSSARDHLHGNRSSHIDADLGAVASSDVAEESVEASLHSSLVVKVHDLSADPAGAFVVADLHRGTDVLSHESVRGAVILSAFRDGIISKDDSNKCSKEEALHERVSRNGVFRCRLIPFFEGSRKVEEARPQKTQGGTTLL